MHAEVDYLVTLLLQMQLADFGKNDTFMEIVESMKFVRKSKVRVGIELSKALNGKQPSKSNLIVAENYIQDAIDALVPAGEQSDINNLLAINDLLDEFEINVDLLLFTDKELEDLTKAVRERFFAFDNEDVQEQEPLNNQQDEQVMASENYLDGEAYDDWYAEQEATYGQWASEDDAIEQQMEQLVVCQLPSAAQSEILNYGVTPTEDNPTGQVPNNDPSVWPPTGSHVQMMPNQCTMAHGNYEGGPNPDGSLVPSQTGDSEDANQGDQ